MTGTLHDPYRCQPRWMRWSPRSRPRRRGRAAERARSRADGAKRRSCAAAEQRAAQLDALAQLRPQEGLDLLVDTWQPDTGGFIHDGQLASIWLRRAVPDIAIREPVNATDRIEARVRAWLATRPSAPSVLCDAVRGCYGA